MIGEDRMREGMTEGAGVETETGTRAEAGKEVRVEEERFSKGRMTLQQLRLETTTNWDPTSRSTGGLWHRKLNC